MARSGCGFKIWTYILFGSISMQTVRFLNNLGWSRGLRSRPPPNTAPGPRAPALGDPCLLGDRPWRSTSRKSAPKQCSKLANTWETHYFWCLQLITQPRWNRRQNHGKIGKFEPLNQCKMYTKQHGNLIKNTPILGSPTELTIQTNLWKRLSDVLGRAWLRPNRVVEFGIEGT